MGENDVFCWICKKPCIGEVLKFEGRIFHPNCLTCCICNCQLANKPIFVFEDQYYCSDDYFQQYGQKCYVCGEFIEGEALSVNGNVYHVACFVCSTCGKPFPDGERITYDGKNYKCEKCPYANMPPASEIAPPASVNVPQQSTNVTQQSKNRPEQIVDGPQPRNGDIGQTRVTTTLGPRSPSTLQKCAGCGEELRGSQALLALEKQWHLWCFKCCRCASLLSGEYMAKDGQPYCEKCYQNLYGIACAGCGSYITGKVLQAGSKHYHPRCSRCAKCNQVFGEGEEMYLQGNEIWHPRCSDEAALEIKQMSRSVPSNPPAPTPPLRTASHHKEWNTRYQQNGLPDEKPTRESRPRPYSYHDASSAAQSYGASDRPSPSSGKDKVLQKDFHHSDSELSGSGARQSVQRYYEYKDLKTTNYKAIKGIDKTQLEAYLSDQEFFDVFSMSKPDFYSLPKWKQNETKKKKFLF